MRTRPVQVLLAAVLAVGGCSASEPDQPAAVRFTKIDLPGGAAPVVLSTARDALLIGVRRDGQPGLLRYRPDGAITDIAVHGESPYGLVAKWYSIDSDGDRILAIGGQRGGAHANVRWTVWTGSTTGIAEKPQGFSVFGGWGAGELVGAVLTPAGPALVGSWQSGQAGLDVAVWTADGDVWTRQDSAGTVLESTRQSLGFANAVTALRQGVLVAGMQLTDGRQVPVVWRSTSGNTGWSLSPLPDAGQTGVAMGVRCWGEVCGVAGSIDGKLALWRLADNAWVRLPGTPPIPVTDGGRLVAPIELDGRLTQIVADGGQVKIARADGDKWTVRGAVGPTGTVTAVTRIGGAIYVLAGPDEDTQALWKADIGSLG
jgi:hypothetical protein